MNTSPEIVRLEPLAVRPAQAAQMLSISLRKFAEMKASGLLPPSYKLGGCSVFLTSDLKLWAALGFPNLDRFLALQAEENNK